MLSISTLEKHVYDTVYSETLTVSDIYQLLNKYLLDPCMPVSSIQAFNGLASHHWLADEATGKYNSGYKLLSHNL